jgi:peroxiredoxin
MKKIIPILIIGLFATCKSRTRGETFPAFDILLADSTTRVNTTTIKKGNPIVLLYFSPDCEHCQKVTEAILQHMSAMKQAQFYFITNDPFERLKVFNGQYKLNHFPNIILGRDEQFFLFRHFKGVYPPYLVLYDRHKQQKATFQGETSVDTIISLVNHL